MDNVEQPIKQTFALLREAGKDHYIYFKEVDPKDGLLRYLVEPQSSAEYMTFKSFKKADKYKRQLLIDHQYLHFSDLEVKQVN